MKISSYIYFHNSVCRSVDKSCRIAVFLTEFNILFTRRRVHLLGSIRLSLYFTFIDLRLYFYIIFLLFYSIYSNIILHFKLKRSSDRTWLLWVLHSYHLIVWKGFIMGDNYTQMMHNSENFHDVYQKLNLSDDFLFSKVMQDEEILRLLLEKILNFLLERYPSCSIRGSWR